MTKVPKDLIALLREIIGYCDHKMLSTIKTNNIKSHEFSLFIAFQLQCLRVRTYIPITIKMLKNHGSMKPPSVGSIESGMGKPQIDSQTSIGRVAATIYQSNG
jgi:hypothetical protein